VFDDESVVVNNIALQEFSNIPKYFAGGEGFNKVIGRYYRPIVSTLYTVDYAIWGLNPMGFHITNIIIHVISCLLLFAILMQLFGEYKYGIIASLIAALVFAAHPIHTEAVSWISGRTDSLVTLFFFAAFLFYIKFIKSNEDGEEQDADETGKSGFQKYKFLIYSLLFYFFGLLSKEMIITFPVVIILYDFIYRKKTLSYIKENLNVYISIVALTIVYLVVRYIVLIDVVERETYAYFYGMDFVTVTATMLKTVPMYFKLLFVPINLLYHYNGFIPDSNSFFDINVILSILFIALLIYLSIFFYKRHSVISFCLLFFIVSLIPVMNIVPTMNLMAERFLYITSFSLSILIAYLMVKFMNENNLVPTMLISLIVILLLSFFTYERNKDWKDNNTLYYTGKDVEGTVLLTNYGNIFANNKQFGQAEIMYRKAIELRDNALLAHHNLGLIYLIKGQLDSAEIKFKKGLSIDSLAPDGYLQLANVYQTQGRIGEAIDQLEKLQTIIPDYRDSKAMLEVLKQQYGDQMPSDIKLPDSINTEKEMLDKRSYKNYQDKKYKKAIVDLEKLIIMAPELKSGYLNNIALCYEGLGDLDKAIEYLKKAIEEDERNINAYNGLANIYLKKGDKKLAIEQYKNVLLINPEDENAISKLDSISKLE
jgi:tetratricopeptide (TPR) repeat protein